jgi:fatty acid desaturase
MKRSFLTSRYAPCLTHFSLAALTSAYFALLVSTPFWIAFVSGVVIAHRIGILLHEYLHGIPFRHYRNNLAIASLFDGLLLMFGMLELYRGTHLSHHQWLNTDGDPAMETTRRARRNRMRDLCAAPEAIQFLIYLRDAFRGKRPYVRRNRLLIGVVLSTLSVLFWVWIGRGDVVWKMLGITAYTTLLPISLRGAIEHHSYRGDPRFANEYRVWIPMFNLNRHIHHHENPRAPWYLLEFRTKNPLSLGHYMTYWFRVYLKRDLVLMQPMDAFRTAVHRSRRTYLL